MLNTALIAAVLSATPGLASDRLASTAPAAVPPEEKMVCKRQALTGTRFAKKVCHTAAQWDARAEADRRALAEATGNSVQRDSGRN